MIKECKKSCLLFGAALGLTATLLSGCTSSQSGNLNNGAAASGTGASSTQTTQASQSSSTASGSGDSSPDLVLSSADGNQGQGTSQTGQTSSSTQGTTSSQTSSDSSQTRGDIITYDEQNQNGEEPSSSVYDADAEESSSENLGADEFTGSFSKQDDSESVTLSFDNDTSLTFSFAVCGIHGTAQVTGRSAVYTGDDDYTITFAVSGDILTVTVGGQDAEASAINGTYYRSEETEA